MKNLVRLREVSPGMLARCQYRIISLSFVVAVLALISTHVRDFKANSLCFELFFLHLYQARNVNFVLSLSLQVIVPVAYLCPPEITFLSFFKISGIRTILF